MASDLIDTYEGGVIIEDKPILIGSSLEDVYAQILGNMILKEQRLGWDEYRLNFAINDNEIAHIRLLFYKRCLDIIEVEINIGSELYRDCFMNDIQALSEPNVVEKFKWGEVKKVLEKDRNIAKILLIKITETSA